MSATTPSTLASSSTKPSPTANTKPARLPAPTLFVGPPSRNASQLSIARTTTHDSALNKPRDPTSRHKSALSRRHNAGAEASVDDAEAPAAGSLPPLKKASDKAVEAKWKEMQSTLNEVELTAQSSTHVFGESHAAALDDLRRAQIKLAQAWGRGNERQADASDDLEQNINRFQHAEDIAADRANAYKRRHRAGTTTTSSTALSDESGTSVSDVTSKDGRSQLVDETAADIKLASERRAANEAYFKKVDGGVKDVVAKLAMVAEAMRGVEGESRSLWSTSSDRTEATVERDAQVQSDAKAPAG